MRRFLAAALMLSAGPVMAAPADDYSACLIGYSVVALVNMERIEDPYQAVEAARAECPAPDGVDVAALDDYVDEIVEEVAGALNGARQ